MNVKKLFDLTNEKAIVTGAAQGLGKEMAIAMAEGGADVAIVDINMDGALKVSKSIQALGVDSIPVKTDVTKIAEIENMVKI